MPKTSIFPRNNAIRAAIKALHARPEMAVMYTTGAALDIGHLLWTVPGSSNTIILPASPYLRGPNWEILRRRPAYSVSAETAICLATRAFEDGKRHLATEKRQVPAMGLGLTAVVETEPVNPEVHEVYAAVRTEHGIWVAYLNLERGRWNRVTEGRLCTLLGLNLLLHGAGLPTLPGFFNVPLTFVSPQIEASPLLFNHVLWPNGQREEIDVLSPKMHVIYPGSYDPVTFGHEGLAGAFEFHSSAIGERKRVVFLINTVHPDKGTVPIDDCARRADQLLGKWPVVLNTEGARYIDMARTFPGYTFLLGIEVLRRIFRDLNDEERTDLLRAFDRLGTRFAVGGRTGPDGVFRKLSDANIPDGFLHLFTEVQGQWDISSTAMRNATIGA